MNITSYNIILGSSSPRRKKILSDMGLIFEVRVSQVNENFPADLQGKEVSEFLAKLKSDNLIEDLKINDLLITADTIVVNNNKILNKPLNSEEAKDMLLSISGRTHKVISSVCLRNTDKCEVFSEETLVTFLNLSEDIISFYIDNYQPFDKAGSYGIQEWIGLVNIEKIVGSYTNVVGLPSSKLFHKIRNF